MGTVRSWLLARAGKVGGQTPKVAKQDKKKPKGYVYKRLHYNREFITAVVGFGNKKGPTC